MSSNLVSSRLHALLTDTQPRVLLLSGDWGTGKTYLWRQATKSIPLEERPKRIAYVSAFGLSSASELRKKIAAETVATVQLKKGSKETVGDVVQSNEWKLRPLELMRILPVLPYVSKLESAAYELSFELVKGAVVCIDDLERAGRGLDLSEILGLASFLREERDCRVLLIINERQLTEQAASQLARYLEKSIDERVELAPTSSEAFDIARTGCASEAVVQLGLRLQALDVCNIRVMSRLVRLANDLEAALAALHPRALAEAVMALALYGACHYAGDDRLPSTSWLDALDRGLGRYARRGKKDAPKSEAELKEERWFALVDEYGYASTSGMDAEIGRSVVRGYLDTAALLAEAQKMAREFEAADRLDAFSSALRDFWREPMSDGKRAVALLLETAHAAVTVLPAGDMNTVYCVLRDVGQVEQATDLLERFIRENQHRPRIFDLSESHFRDNYATEVLQRLDEEAAVHFPPSTLDEALDRIDFSKGWNSEDVRTVARATPEDVERLLKTAPPGTFRVRVKTLLGLGSVNNAGAEEKSVSQAAELLLRSWAESDPIAKARLTPYLPKQVDHEES